MKIANVEIKEENILSITFNGTVPEQIKNTSLNGKGRSCVTIKMISNYTIEIIGLDKMKYSELWNALHQKALTNELISIDMYPLLKAEIPSSEPLENTALDFEVDIAQIRPNNRGSYYDISMPIKYIEY